MNKKNITQICIDFQKELQKIVDDSKGKITSISITTQAVTKTIAKQKPIKSPKKPPAQAC